MRPNMSSRGGSTSEDPSSPDAMATIADDDEASEEDRLAALEHLGSPPYFRALLLLAQMSSKDNFFFPQYTDACATHARLNRNFVMGFIAQKTKSVLLWRKSRVASCPIDRIVHRLIRVEDDIQDIEVEVEHHGFKGIGKIA